RGPHCSRAAPLCLATASMEARCSARWERRAARYMRSRVPQKASQSRSAKSRHQSGLLKLERTNPNLQSHRHRAHRAGVEVAAEEFLFADLQLKLAFRLNSPQNHKSTGTVCQCFAVTVAGTVCGTKSSFSPGTL